MPVRSRNTRSGVSRRQGTIGMTEQTKPASPTRGPGSPTPLEVARAVHRDSAGPGAPDAAPDPRGEQAAASAEADAGATTSVTATSTPGPAAAAGAAGAPDGAGAPT